MVEDSIKDIHTIHIGNINMESNHDFTMTLFIGRLTRRLLLAEIYKALLLGIVKNKDEAIDLAREIMDSENASQYLIDHPERIIVP